MLKSVLLLTMISLKLYSQEIDVKFNQIKSIPCNYYPKAFPKESVSSIKIDTSFKYIIDLDTTAVAWLIEKINDTTLTSINKPGEKSLLKQGDLAIILIDHIILIPWSKITQEQFDICCLCGALPNGFLSYLDKHRSDFQLKYRKYYYFERKK